MNCLSDKKLDYVRSTEGKLKLKEEILSRMQHLMTHKAIKQIYYTEFSLSTPSR
jgi:flagellar basal body-associated protein FliL